MKKAILIIFPLFVLVCFVIFWVEPKLNLWQMDRSIVFKYQDLPKFLMFDPLPEGDKLIVSQGKEQFALAGPDLTLFSGKYEYNLELVPLCDNTDIGFMDVVRQNGRQGLGAKEIISGKSGEILNLSVPFEAGLGSDYEFRFFTNGACSVEIKNVYLVREENDYKPLLFGIWQSLKKIVK